LRLCRDLNVRQLAELMDTLRDAEQVRPHTVGTVTTYHADDGAPGA
jgi:hypothetical protein